MNITPASPALPIQKVLVDEAAVMDYPADQPADETKAIVESYATGPLVLDRSRIKPIA